MKDKSTGTSEPTVVRSHLRGLEVLEALNAHNYVTAAQLSKKVGLPRATVHRLLDTLVEAQFITYDEEEGVYCLSSRIKKISAGYDNKARLIEVAKPYVREFTQTEGWPSYLFEQEGATMVTRAIARAPRAFSFPRIGQRFELTASAPGRAYLASLEGKEQEQWLLSPSGQSEVMQGQLKGLIRDAGLLGCGFRDGGIVPKTTSIALPIRDGQTAVAYWTIVFMRSVVSVNKALDHYLPRAVSAIQQIERDLTVPV